MPSPELMLAISGALAVVFLIVAYVVWRKSRISPEERERRRRHSLAAYGKMSDATLVDLTESMIMYAYSVRGVEYTASQDVTRLRAYLPPDLSALGPVAVKYDPKNPANSIIVAEQWTGLRV